MGDFWLFSFGSNHLAQLEARLGHPVKDVQPAYIDGFRRVFHGKSRNWGGPVAALFPGKGTTYGFVAKIDDADRRKLDVYEGAHRQPPIYELHGGNRYGGVFFADGRKVPGARLYNKAAVVHDFTSTPHGRPLRSLTAAKAKYKQRYGLPTRAYCEAVAKTIAPFWQGSGGPVTWRDVCPEVGRRRNPSSTPAGDIYDGYQDWVMQAGWQNVGSPQEVKMAWGELVAIGEFVAHMAQQIPAMTTNITVEPCVLDDRRDQYVESIAGPAESKTGGWIDPAYRIRFVEDRDRLRVEQLKAMMGDEDLDDDQQEEAEEELARVYERSPCFDMIDGSLNSRDRQSHAPPPGAISSHRGWDFYDCDLEFSKHYEENPTPCGYTTASAPAPFWMTLGDIAGHMASHEKAGNRFPTPVVVHIDNESEPALCIIPEPSALRKLQRTPFGILSGIFPNYASFPGTTSAFMLVWPHVGSELIRLGGGDFIDAGIFPNGVQAVIGHGP